MSVSTENKSWWCEAGADLEKEFVARLPLVGFTGWINPEKATNPYVHDLFVEGHIADLKCQNAPFFTATRYRMDPQFTVTFNLKDFTRYRELYPSIDIFFWVRWMMLEGFGSIVKPMSGVWRASFPAMRFAIESGNVPLHDYIRRVDDTQGNAKSSYLFDLRRFERVTP